MSKKSLIVDDDFFFVEFLSGILEARGHEIIKAYDGKQGIAKLEEGPVDFIFVDLVIPKIDAMQFIEFVRKKYPEAKVPIIAVAGTMVEQRDQLEKVGANYYVAKGPTDSMTGQLSEFLDKIENTPLAENEDSELVELGQLFPRQATIQLMDRVNFERAIIESIGMGVMVIDRDARIMRANSLALDILGKSFEDVLNLPVTAIAPADEREDLANILKTLVKDPETRKISQLITIHSREVGIIASGLRIDNEMVGWIIVLEDTEEIEEMKNIDDLESSFSSD
jgi:PAS domain S-box-containing protein